ncbi:hypothetical protein BDN72DRAFT_866490, partial [Pluteus cervinus]
MSVLRRSPFPGVPLSSFPITAIPSNSSNCTALCKLSFDILFEIVKLLPNCPNCLWSLCDHFEEVCNSMPLLWSNHELLLNDPRDCSLALEWLRKGKPGEYIISISIPPIKDQIKEQENRIRFHHFLHQIDTKTKVMSLRSYALHLQGLTKTLHLSNLVELTLD